jgi:glycosyltransferase involved in cell wall biosynthesis
MNHPPLSHLLHPELVQNIPIIGSMAASALDSRAEATLRDNPAEDPPVSVVIRARNEAPQLQSLLHDVSRQTVGHEVEIIVVDNESTDTTREVAREYGATVVNLPKNEFTYPRSMNLGVEAASCDEVFLTVAHAQFATRVGLHAAARHFRSDSNVAGVFGGRASLPASNASPSDLFGSMLNSPALLRGPARIKKASMGVLAAVGMMISKSAWQELGRFDETYESGGEDTLLARRMLANNYGIICDTAAMMHHSHGNNAITNLKEVWHYAKTLRAPQKLEGTIKERRQDRFRD